MASNEAFKKQAEGASVAAKKYMEDNELLQEVSVTIMIVPQHTPWWGLSHLSESSCTESSSGSLSCTFLLLHMSVKWSFYRFVWLI